MSIEHIIQKYPGAVEHWEKAKSYLKSDPPNSAEEAVKALESVTKTIYGDNRDFPVIMKEWANEGKIPKLLYVIFVKLYGYRGDETAHGKIEPLKVEIGEADYILNECANAIVYLYKKRMKGKDA